MQNIEFPGQVSVKKATAEDLKEIEEDIIKFCEHFECDVNEILNSEFTIVTPDSKNPYKQMYVAN